MTTTENHNWDIPTVGGDTDQWGTILNTFFTDELDSEIVLQDTFANRPTAADTDLTLFLATDRRIVYRNTGSSWEAVYGLGTASNPVPGESVFGDLTADTTLTDPNGTAHTGELADSVDIRTDEEIEDVVAALISPDSGVSVTYDDGTDTLTLGVVENEIDHDALQNYVTSEHVDHSTTDVIAGTLLTGGGAIDSDVTLDVDEGSISHDGIDQTTVSSDDHHTRYTDEEAQDAINALLSSGNAISFTYDDANDTLTASVIDGEIDHDSLNQYVATEHVDHSNVTITAGAGLTGGGDITTSRTLDAHSVQSITSNYTAGENDVVLADASGGALTVTLPAPATDVMMNVKKTDASANAVTIATPGSETIDGVASKSITAENGALTITSDGSNYYIV